MQCSCLGPSIFNELDKLLGWVVSDFVAEIEVEGQSGQVFNVFDQSEYVAISEQIVARHIEIEGLEDGWDVDVGKDLGRELDALLKMKYFERLSVSYLSFWRYVISLRIA